MYLLALQTWRSNGTLMIPSHPCSLSGKNIFKTEACVTAWVKGPRPTVAGMDQLDQLALESHRLSKLCPHLRALVENHGPVAMERDVKFAQQYMTRFQAALSEG